MRLLGLVVGLVVLVGVAASPRPAGAQFSISSGPNETNNNNELVSMQQTYFSTSPQQQQHQQQKFRVNVSNICERNQMRVTVRINKPFYGLIHTKDKRRKQACYVEGNGEQAYHLDIHYTQVTSDPHHCGVVAHQQQAHTQTQTQEQKFKANESINQVEQQQTLSVILVVRLHKSIEFSDDRFFLLSCANRCTRSDCSNSNNNPSANQSNQISAKLTASESISSPIISPSTTFNGHQAHPNQLADPQPTAVCHDLMLELKFQWIVRLCWILASLFGFAVLLIFCLCVSLHKLQRVHKLRNQRPTKRNATLRRTKSKQILCTSTGDSSNNHNNDSSTTENCSWSAATTEDEVFQPKQQVLGRAMIASMGPNQQPGVFPNAQPRQAEQIRRRRSISGSLHQPPEIQVPSTMDHHHHHQQQQQQQQYSRFEGKLTASQRAKSQSQTTIHYEQGQDPFKAVPFSYINTGYQSDVPTTTTNVMTSDYFNHHTYVHQNQQQSSTNMIDEREILVGQTLKESPIIQARQHIENQQQQVWPAYGNNKPSLMSPPPPPPPVPPQTVVGLNHHQTDTVRQQQISQFDPQNSRQLIDLIQHKHRQQMVQANRTAALMQQPASQGGETGANNTEMQLRQPNVQHWRN